MKKLLFIGAILTSLFLFALSIRANIPPAPENEFIINKTLKQCAITKFNSKLPLGWERYDICFDYSGCPKIMEDILKKDQFFIKDVCDSGYLNIWYSDDNWHNLETHLQESIDYTKTETFYLGIEGYSRGDVLVAVNATTGECNFAENEHVRSQGAVPKISFKIKEELEDKINQYLYGEEYHEEAYKAFCKASGYIFIGNLKNYQLAKMFLLVGGIIIIIVGTIVFIRRRRANKK